MTSEATLEQANSQKHPNLFAALCCTLWFINIAIIINKPKSSKLQIPVNAFNRRIKNPKLD
jgi:hypothetical protein